MPPFFVVIALPGTVLTTYKNLGIILCWAVTHFLVTAVIVIRNYITVAAFDLITFFKNLAQHWDRYKQRVHPQRFHNGYTYIYMTCKPGTVYNVISYNSCTVQGCTPSCQDPNLFLFLHYYYNFFIILLFNVSLQ